jgi:5'-3' exonuclease
VKKNEAEDETFDLYYINILREYFELEYSYLKAKMTKLKFDIDRVIDDFVFFSFFIGNDFLPRYFIRNHIYFFISIYQYKNNKLQKF